MADITISTDEYESLKANAGKLEEANKKLSSFESVFEARFATLSNEKAEVEGQMAEMKLGHQMDKTLMGAGIGDEGVIDYLRYRYSQVKTEEGQDKADFGTWFKTYQDSKPSILSGFSKKAEVGDPATGGKVEPVIQTEPVKESEAASDPAAGRVQPQGDPAQGEMTPAQLAALPMDQFEAAWGKLWS